MLFLTIHISLQLNYVYHWFQILWFQTPFKVFLKGWSMTWHQNSYYIFRRAQEPRTEKYILYQWGKYSVLEKRNNYDSVFSHKATTKCFLWLKKRRYLQVGDVVIFCSWHHVQRIASYMTNHTAKGGEITKFFVIEERHFKATS